MIIKYFSERAKNRYLEFFNKNPVCVCIGICYRFSGYMFRVIDGYGRVVNLEFEYFDILDNRIPDGWIFHYFPEIGSVIAPQEFTGEFWDRFDGEDGTYAEQEEAQALFKEVVNKIYAFHGLPPHFVEEKEPEPLKEHEWWKEYVDEDES